jgi:hypothetical protein
MVGAVVFVFPGVDEEAVEAAESGEEDGGEQEQGSEVGTACDGGDEGGGGEEEADGDLLGESVGNLVLGRGAACRVDEEEVAGDEGSEDEVEADCCRVEVRKKRCEGDGGENDYGEEGRAVAMMEEVTGFEAFVMCRLDA